MTQSVEPSVFEQYDVARWQVGTSSKIAFAVLEVVESVGKRIVRHPRPYREEEKLDDTGLNSRQFKVTAIFDNGILEPGLEANGVVAYPDALRLLMDTFRHRLCGDLELPTVGLVRARAMTAERRETRDRIDQAVVDLVWLTDNEDSLDAAQLNAKSVRATAASLSEQTQFSAQSAGAWDDNTSTLFEAAGQLETMLRAPGRAVADVKAQAETMGRLVRQIADAQMSLANVVGGEFNEPRGSAVHRQLRELEDRVALAESEKARSLPPTTTFVIDVERCSIFDISARLKQQADELLDLNSARIVDPFDLQRGDVIRVFA